VRSFTTCLAIAPVEQDEAFDRRWPVTHRRSFAEMTTFATLVPNSVDNPLPLALILSYDTAFLTIILVELLHTVLSRGPIGRQVQEFLVIGITSRRCAIAWRSPPATVAQATAPLPRPRAPTMW